MIQIIYNDFVIGVAYRKSGNCLISSQLIMDLNTVLICIDTMSRITDFFSIVYYLYFCHVIEVF